MRDFARSIREKGGVYAIKSKSNWLQLQLHALSEVVEVYTHSKVVILSSNARTIDRRQGFWRGLLIARPFG